MTTKEIDNLKPGDVVITNILAPMTFAAMDEDVFVFRTRAMYLGFTREQLSRKGVKLIDNGD